MRSMRDQWQALRDSDAVWQHPGDARAPHVVLRSGRHSDGFIDTLQHLLVLENLVQGAHALASLIRERLGSEKIDWVFGSPMAGIPFATMVGHYLDVGRVAFTEKTADKELICRFDVPAGARILLVEEMTTTGGTPRRVMDAILKRNPEADIISSIGAFLIRCERTPPELEGLQLLPVVDLPELGVTFNEWTPEECPLCADGSEAIENCKRVWSDLLRTMEDPEYMTRQATA